MTPTVILPILWPLFAGLLLVWWRRYPLDGQRVLALVALVVQLGIALHAFSISSEGGYDVYNLGNWLAPFGIVLVLDRLAAFMLLLTAVLALPTWWYAVATKVDKQGAYFHVLFQWQLVGLNGAFLTGDVFNLFVFFEVLLLASYGLMLHGGGRERLVAGFHYVVVNLLGSVLFLFAVGALYSALGSLNLADMALKVAQAPAERQGLIAAAGLLLLVVFALKAAMFPLYLWLPATYANTSAPVAALFAIMTKVGVYAIVRVHGTLFGVQAGALAYLHVPWVLGGGLLTLLVASLGVIAANRLREQVSYLVLTSVATLLIAIGLNQAQSLAAGLYYWLHSTLLTGGFFLLAGQIAHSRGSADDWLKPAILSYKAWLGTGFFLAAIAVIGLPPLSGFLGKLIIMQAALTHTWWWLIVLVMLVASLLLLAALVRSGSVLFFSIPAAAERHVPEVRAPLNRMAGIATGVLLVMSPVLVWLAAPLSHLTAQISVQILDIPAYIQAVLGNVPVGGLP